MYKRFILRNDLAHSFLKGALFPLIRNNAQAALVRKFLRAAVKSAALAGAKRDHAENDALSVVLFNIGQRYGTVDLLHTKKYPLTFSMCPFHDINMNE